MRRSLVAPGKQGPAEGSDGTSFWLLVVGVYKHVGTKMPFDLSHAEEVSCRTTMMHQGAQKLRKRILTNSLLSISKRLVVLQVYMFTKGLFQAGTWAELPQRVYNKLHSCIKSLYRMVSGHQYKGLYSDVTPDSDLLSSTRSCLL